MQKQVTNHSRALTGCHHTSNNRFDSAGQAQASESVVEYLIVLEGGRRVVCNFDTGGETVENSIPPQYGYALSTNQNSGLSVAENIILLQNSWKKSYIKVALHSCWTFEFCFWLYHVAGKFFENQVS